MNKDVLLEIGTEELPAHYMPGALQQLKEAAAAQLTEAHIAYKDIRTMGTPRRLAHRRYCGKTGRCFRKK